MTDWEEILDNKKTWSKCQQFIEDAYIARKHSMDAKEQKQEDINKITEEDLHMYLAAIKVKTEEDTKEHDEHIKQVTEKNAALLALVQEQQKKIKNLLIQSNPS